MDPAEAIDIFTILLRTHLESFLKRDSLMSKRRVHHHSRRIKKVIEKKKTSARSENQPPSQFFNALMAHSKCLTAKWLYDYTPRTWQETCMGSSAETKPNFSATEAYSHYANVVNGATSWYNTPENPGLPVQINEVMLSPSPDEIPFDLDICRAPAGALQISPSPDEMPFDHQQ